MKVLFYVASSAGAGHCEGEDKDDGRTAREEAWKLGYVLVAAVKAALCPYV